MAITVNSLNTPEITGINVIAGGNLPVSKTFYFRVTAINTYSPRDITLQSKASIEASFSTTDTNRQVNITWDAVPNAAAYEVYLTQTSGDYRKRWYDNASLNFRTVYSSSVLVPSTTTNSITLDSAKAIYSHWLYPYHGVGVELPGTLDFDCGLISVTADNAESFEDIIDAIITAGFPENAYRTSNDFGFLWVYLMLSGTGERTYLNKKFNLIRASISTYNSNYKITYGAYNSIYDLTYDQCNFIMSLQAWISAYGATHYGTTMLFQAFGATQDYYFYDEQGSLSHPNYADLLKNVSLNPGDGAPYTAGEDLEGIKATCELGTLSRRYLYWSKWIKNCEFINYQWFGYWSQGEPKFRDTVLKAYLGSYSDAHCQVYHPKGVIHFYFYDCTFADTLDNLPRAYWNYTAGGGIVAVFHSMVIKTNPGASLILKNKNGEIVSQKETDGEGEADLGDVLTWIVEKDLEGAKAWRVSSGNSNIKEIDYNPFTLIITKEGYQDYSHVFNFNQKLSWEITLIEEPEITSINRNIQGLISKSVISGTLISQVLIGTKTQKGIKGNINTKINLQGNLQKINIEGEINQ